MRDLPLCRPNNKSSAHILGEGNAILIHTFVAEFVSKTSSLLANLIHSNIVTERFRLMSRRAPFYYTF